MVKTKFFHKDNKITTIKRFMSVIPWWEWPDKPEPDNDTPDVTSLHASSSLLEPVWIIKRSR